MLEAQAHQDLPFERLVEALKPERSPGRNPLTQVKFLLQEDWARIDQIGDARCTVLDPIEVGARFDLALDVIEHSDGLACEFTYASDLFEQSTIARLAARYEALLAAIVEGPEVHVGALRIAEEVVAFRYGYSSGQRCSGPCVCACYTRPGWGRGRPRGESPVLERIVGLGGTSGGTAVAILH